jgi:hypothetical protein
MHSERRLAMLECGKLLVTVAALAGFLLFTGAPRVRANESECEHRTERADHHLHEAIDGLNSCASDSRPRRSRFSRLLACAHRRFLASALFAT